MCPCSLFLCCGCCNLTAATSKQWNLYNGCFALVIQWRWPSHNYCGSTELGSHHFMCKDWLSNHIWPHFFPSEWAIMQSYMQQQHHGTSHDICIQEVSAEQILFSLLGSLLSFLFVWVTVLWTRLLQIAWPAYAENLHSFHFASYVCLSLGSIIFIIILLRTLWKAQKVIYKQTLFYLFL